ncbi:unnamed protein product [Nesidiocoris tenuis]|uniref:Ras-related protein Rab-9A n=1 Tax=Nesidiocoris tenuis TaxID=355587 RepID=A0A6H5GK30_9HEMI|nr:unnamed protein product [Nesidiocoris tenuis]
MAGKSPHNKNCLLKVIILGDGGVGKSCLMNRFVNNHFDDHSFHTIGVEFLNKEMRIKNDTYTLQIWDTAGQERFKSLRTPFYRGSDICMLTFAVDDESSFQSLTMWKNEFIYYSDIKDGSAFPFVVVANKLTCERCVAVTAGIFVPRFVYNKVPVLPRCGRQKPLRQRQKTPKSPQI